MATGFATIARSLLSWVLAATLLAVVIGAFYYFHRFDEELRHHIEAALAQQYPNHSITVASAHLIRGESIRLRGLSIVQPASAGQNNRTELVFCEEAVLQCTPTLEELVRGKIEIPHIELRRLTLNPTRENDGSWNFEDLIPSTTMDRPVPTIAIQDANVELIDRRSSPPTVLILGKLNGSITPNAIPTNDRSEPSSAARIDIWANFTNDHAQEVSVRGSLDPQTLAWSAQGQVTDIRFTPELLRMLPPDAIAPLVDLDGFRARGDLRFGIEKQQHEPHPRYRIEGTVTDGRLEATRHLNAPITEIEAKKISLDNHGWRVDELQATYGVAKINVSASGQRVPGDQAMTVWGTVRDLDVTPELITAFPETLQEKWRKYQPTGLLDVAFRADRQMGQWWVEATANCHNVSLICEKFNYPLVGARGTAHYRQNETLKVDLWASHDHASDERPIHITANVLRPGPDSYGTISVTSDEWVRFDQRMARALTPRVQKILSDMQAHGEFRVSASFVRGKDEPAPPRRDIAIQVRNGSILHQQFPYPLGKVRGTIHVTDDQWQFKQFAGSNDSSTVECVGNWTRDPNQTSMPGEPARGQLLLNFTAREIPCDTELRQALPDGPKRIWTSLRPTGTIDHAQVSLTHRSGMGKPALDVRVTQMQRGSDPERRSLEIQPTWFPLQMDRVTGSFVYERDGTFQLHNIRAVHGSSQRSFALQAEGSGEFRQDGQWLIQLNKIYADGVGMSPEVKSALPLQMRSTLERLDFQGQLSVSGNMQFIGNSDPRSPVQSNWHSAVNIDNGNLWLAGQEVQDVYGEIIVDGENSAEGWTNYGTAVFDNLMCKGVQITGINTPWRLEPTRLVFGLPAYATAISQRQRLQARVFGGTLEADGIVSLVGDNDFRINMQLADFNATRVAGDLNTPSKISGTGQAQLDLQGNSQGTHSLNGKGSVTLRDANLAKLPAIISLLNTIGTRASSPDVFSASNIEFTVQGPHLNLSLFDLHGESLSLKGQGWISFDRQIELAFYSIIGGERMYHALLRPLVGQASQQFLRILVSGSIDDAEWTREVLPGLNESLQQLFADPNRTTERQRVGIRR